jgi:hypothetical protein
VRYEEGRNGGLPRGNSKFIFLRAYRRFFLPPYEPKQPVIPNSENRSLRRFGGMRDLLLTAGT